MDFPNGGILIAMEGKVGDLSNDYGIDFDEIVLFFEESTVILRPISETDEISIGIGPGSRVDRRRRRVQLFPDLIGKQLNFSWISANNQGYQDLIVMAFDGTTPNFGVLCVGSMLQILNIDLLRTHG
ncbi:MAG: hypothetical protein JWQ98_28 [Chlorobi bacterium]|nr:hypothetical protein [Chlorobiota bacterium]